MENLNLPTGHQAVMPYLIVKDATKFLSFMQTVFGARETARHMRDDTSIMHAELAVGESTIMFADAAEPWPPQTAGMFIYVPDTDVAYQKALAAGATSVMEPADQSYGRSAGVTDPFGNTWWITAVKTQQLAGNFQNRPLEV